MNYYLEGKTVYEKHNALLIKTKLVRAKIRPILSPNLKVPDPFEEKSFWVHITYTIKI